MPATLAQKLQIKSGKLIVLNAPKGCVEKLTAELEGVAVSAKAFRSRPS